MTGSTPRPASDCSRKQKEPLFNCVCFFILGWINNFGYCVMLSAAKDLLDSRAPTALVLFCDVFPDWLFKLVAPLFIHKIGMTLRALLTALMAFSGFILATFADKSIATALIGVSCHSISSGLGEITFLAYSARFSTAAVSMWSSGTGFAGVTGSGLYLILVDLFGANDKTVLFCFSALPVLLFECYVLSSPERSPGEEHKEEENDVLIAQLSQREKLQSLKQVWVYYFSLILVYISEYSINQGVNPVIDFKNSRFYGSFYTFSQFAYEIGVFISRSSLGLFRLPRQYVVIPAVCQFLFLILFSFEALYLFINNFWVMLTLVLIEGLFGGIVYVSAMYELSIESNYALRGYRLGIASLCDSTGILIASPIGMLLETFLSKEKQW